MCHFPPATPFSCMKITFLSFYNCCNFLPNGQNFLNFLCTILKFITKFHYKGWPDKDESTDSHVFLIQWPLFVTPGTRVGQGFCDRRLAEKGEKCRYVAGPRIRAMQCPKILVRLKIRAILKTQKCNFHV